MIKYVIIILVSLAAHLNINYVKQWLTCAHHAVWFKKKNIAGLFRRGEEPGVTCVRTVLHR